MVSYYTIYAPYYAIWCPHPSPSPLFFPLSHPHKLYGSSSLGTYTQHTTAMGWMPSDDESDDPGKGFSHSGKGFDYSEFCDEGDDNDKGGKGKGDDPMPKAYDDDAKGKAKGKGSKDEDQGKGSKDKGKGEGSKGNDKNKNKGKEKLEHEPDEVSCCFCRKRRQGP